MYTARAFAFVAAAVGGFFKSCDGGGHHEGVAVQAGEHACEFFFEAREGFFEQVFFLRRAHGHVFEFGLQVEDIVDRHQHNLAAFVNRQVFSP